MLLKGIVKKIDGRNQPTETIRIEPRGFYRTMDFINHAIKIAQDTGALVEFMLGGCKVTVRGSSNPQQVRRALSSAVRHGVRVIGPEFTTQDSLRRRINLQPKNQGCIIEMPRPVQDATSSNDRILPLTRRRVCEDEVLPNNVITFGDGGDWENERMLSRGDDNAFRFAEQWGCLMERELRKGRTIAESARESAIRAGARDFPITVYTRAASLLCLYWYHGDKLWRHLQEVRKVAG